MRRRQSLCLCAQLLSKFSGCVASIAALDVHASSLRLGVQEHAGAGPLLAHSGCVAAAKAVLSDLRKEGTLLSFLQELRAWAGHSRRPSSAGSAASKEHGRSNGATNGHKRSSSAGSCDASPWPQARAWRTQCTACVAWCGSTGDG